MANFKITQQELGATTSIKLVICNFYGCYGGWGTANNTHGFFGTGWYCSTSATPTTTRAALRQEQGSALRRRRGQPTSTTPWGGPPSTASSQTFICEQCSIPYPNLCPHPFVHPVSLCVCARARVLLVQAILCIHAKHFVPTLEAILYEPLSITI